MKPTIIMIGADKGGVGKTFTARCILDYIRDHDIRYNLRVFDTESPKGVLNRFYSDAKIIDLTNVQEQMNVIDNLAGSITIVDIRAGLLSPTLKVFSEIGLLDAVKSGEVNLIVFHVLGPTIASLSEITETAKIISGAKYFLVKNHTNEARFFEWDSNITNSLASFDVINIEQLNETACEYVEQQGIPFSDFINRSDNSFVLRGKVKHWLNGVFTELNRINFPGLIQ